MLRDNWPVIDWREPIGLQERLEGRSSHNGEILRDVSWKLEREHYSVSFLCCEFVCGAFTMMSLAVEAAQLKRRVNNPAHSIAVLNCSGNANRPELNRTVLSRAEPYRTIAVEKRI